MGLTARRSPSGGVGFVLAVGVLVVGGGHLQARRDEARWWQRVERLCACNRPAMERLSGLGAVAVGGLDRVLAAQRRSLEAGCDDLRAAMTRRSRWQSLRGASLTVTAGNAHGRAQRDVGRELGLTCGDEHRVFWEALRTRIARDVEPGSSGSRDVVLVAGEHLRVRDAMCARRAALSLPPRDYVLTAADADRDVRGCER